MHDAAGVGARDAVTDIEQDPDGALRRELLLASEQLRE